MANNTENTNSNSKKKKAVTAAVAVALAVALTAGSTLAYLIGTSDDVKNTFEANYNTVELTETNGAESTEEVDYDFEIVPGTAEKKDPTVTATYTLDSYVFLFVDDDTADLVEYSILTTDNGGVWTLLYDESSSPVDGFAVYYTTVTDENYTDTGTTTDTDGDEHTYYTAELKVLVGDEVSYPATLTNDNMLQDGSLIGDVTLSFRAGIIQASPFNETSDSDTTNAQVALLAFLGIYTEYNAEEDTTLTATLATTIASGSEESTSTTFSVTVPAETTISSGSASVAALSLSVEETTADTTAVLPGGEAGDYSYEISLKDQAGNTVTATEGYIEVAIQIQSGIENLTVTKLDTDTELSDAVATDGSDYYSYDSETGVLTIYTQSLGEYEIYWNDTGISLAELSDDELQFTAYDHSNYTAKMAWGWEIEFDEGTDYTSSSYSDWYIDEALTLTDKIEYSALSCMVYETQLNETWGMTISFQEEDETLHADTEYLCRASMVDLSSSTSYNFQKTVSDQSTKSSLDITKLGILLADSKGNYITGTGTANVELRLYEVDSSGNQTGNYLVIDTMQHTFS